MMKGFRKIAWIFTAVNGFLAVLMGAAATHWFASFLSVTDIKRIETAATYQIYHSLAILALLLAYECKNTLKVKVSISLFMLGIVLFSASLYAYSLVHLKLLVYITPFGGFAFMFGWLSLAFVIKK